MNSVNERFRSIYKQYMPLLRVIARRRQVPYDEIQDIVHEAFVSFYDRYADELLEMPEEVVKRKLFTIVRNQSIDYFRRRSTHPVDYFDPTLMQTLRYSVADEKGDALEVLLEMRKYQDVIDSLKNMKRDWAEIFLLLAIEDRSAEEVSKMLGISPEACRTRLSRARKHLRKELECYEPVGIREKKKTTRKKAPRITETPDSPGVPENA